MYPSHKCTNFTGLGVCTDSTCGKTFDWQSTFNSADAGTYKVAKDFTPRTDAPYDAATKASTSVKKGTSVSVSGSYTNAFGNKWYKFTYDNGKVGYVLHSYLELVNYNNLNVTCTGFKPTENESLPLGQGYPVYGTISSNYPLKKVVAKLDGSQYATWTASNNTTTSFAINPTDINNKLKFGSLSAGKHTVTLVATDIHGRTQTFLVRSFNMVSTSCSHSYSSTYSKDANNHWKVCSKCGSSASVEAHVYTNACDTSCNTCGYTRSITHTYSSECDELCNICGAKRIIYDSAHSYKYMYLNEQKHTEECTMCGRKTEILHNPGTNVIKYTHYNSNQHWFLCKNCEEYFEYLNHYYSNSCDETCNGCDYTRTISHTYSNACDTSCNVCGATRSASHTYSNACDTSCNVCGATRATTHEYDNVCDTSCNLCGETRATNHRYLNACDKTCDVCGAVRSVPDHVYDHDCDTSCNNCGYSRPTSHTYDNNCDGKCNVCGAIRSVSHSYGSSYLSDKNMHWRQCNLCGYKGYSENHIPGAAATETNPQICIICSFVIQPPLGHITHNYSSQYQKNDSQHWYECICGSKKDIQTHQYDNDCDTGCNTCGYVRSITHVFSNACDTECNKCEYTRETEHAFDNGTVTKEPTANEKGEITYICTVCGESKYQDIDIISGGDDNSDDKKPVVDETPNDSKNSGEGVDMPTVIAISVSVAAVISTGTALLIRRKTTKSKVIENNESKEDNIGESISEENESKDEEK